MDEGGQGKGKERQGWGEEKRVGRDSEDRRTGAWWGISQEPSLGLEAIDLLFLAMYTRLYQQHDNTQVKPTSQSYSAKQQH